MIDIEYVLIYDFLFLFVNEIFARGVGLSASGTDFAEGAIALSDAIGIDAATQHTEAFIHAYIHAHI